MGKTGFNMTLLSTLAALVIIVHTAEEEYERAQRGLRSRSLELGSPGYEQTWRAMEIEPTLAEIPQDNSWRSDAPGEVPQRRRLRKRKRRPQIISSEDILPQERHVLPGNVQLHDPSHFVTPPDTIRRRKKQNRKHTREQGISEGWQDQGDMNRPTRRRGHRRKRPPTVESWPKLSEFNDFRPNGAVSETENNDWDNDNHDHAPIYNGETMHNKKQELNRDDMDKQPDDTQDYFNLPIQNNETPEPIILDSNKPDATVQNDRSLSEFSLESLIKSTDDGFKFSEDKVKVIPSDRNKAIIKIAKNNEPLEPLTLKAILKRSNGRSLSEILQQNNLSLADLLQGREHALSLLKTGELTENQENKEITKNEEVKLEPETKNDNYDIIGKSTFIEQRNESETTIGLTSTTENVYTTDTQSVPIPEQHNNFNSNNISQDTTIPHMRRRFPFNLRRKLRTRPVNNTYKGQLSRDLMALSTRKYQNNRNIPKSKEWIDYMPSNTKSRKIKSDIDRKHDVPEIDHITENSNIIITTTVLVEDTTQLTLDREETHSTPNDFYVNVTKSNVDEEEDVSENTEETEFLSTINDVSLTSTEPITEKIVTITQKPKIISHIRSILNATELRRQALSNRLKKKRLRQKNLSNEPYDNLQKNLLETSNMLPASEFIAKTQASTTNTENENDFTTLEDFMPTESFLKHHNRMRSTKPPSFHSSILPKIQPYITATEKIAKFEIEEILNDTLTRARLSRILMERNMTLNELVEHRERGSSHVHLADIFHNASREPNPAEPFLSKSLIEPISKETYPLRALLDANLQDPKSNLDENSLSSNYLSIPIVMDFGNNVNENSENMGITSLFDKNNTSYRDSNGKEESISLVEVKVPDLNKNDDGKGSREGRTLNSEQGLVNWNELFKLLQNQTNQHEPLQQRVSSKSETLQKMLLEEEDNDDKDGIIVFEDLQLLKDNNVASSHEDNLEVKLSQRTHDNPTHAIYNSMNTTRSVTVVTASIIGLALVLFLLTYAGFKWKQQSKMIENKQCGNDDRLPSPIFEDRKGNIRSSTRSKSPMLTSNIYSINTLDTHADVDSPEYMWDSLRKPFQ